MKQATMKVRSMVLYRAVPKSSKDTVAESAPDMLRYDHAYISEKFPGLVLFLDRAPTMACWDTFWFWLHRVGKVQYVEPKDWFTFRRDRSGALLRVSMAEEKDTWGNPIRFQMVGKGCDFETPEDAVQELTARQAANKN